MTKAAEPVLFHGGGIEAAQRRFPDAVLPWIDLSTGINPVPYPLGAVPSDAWHRLPEASTMKALEAVAARAYGAAQPAHVVAAPGTQALIQWLPRLLPARHVAVLGFGYEEHPAVWRAAGAEVVTTEDVHDLRRADVAIVVNPNNPDGRIVNPKRLAALADALAAKGGTLIVDEAFMDVMDPASSLVPTLPARGAIVLRSFGKMFGLAGVRLGFAITGKEVAGRVRVALGPWAVSGPAIAIATRALADERWRREALARLHADATRLDDLLVRAGFTILGGTALFRLVSHDDAGRWFNRLGQAGILVRPFPKRPTWLRFGLPGEGKAWERLGDALRG